LIDNAPRKATVRAIEETVCAIMVRADYDRVLKKIN